ncbi:MAG TPA: hypothetical protein VGT60_07050 [Candidatus Limnocylindria bacterium]|nr:hypothetical protein [Candidatus Limnocylindria bacterium]
MTVLVGIDDTDVLDSRGTGFIARELAAALRVTLGAWLGGITRHQLLVDPRIPYTSHNSSACLSVETASAIDELAAFAGAFLEARAPSGSDPGLCIATEPAAAAVVEFGRRAQQDVLPASEATALAARAGVHLSAHGGTGQGVIGALAAVALRRGGDDGRFLDLGDVRRLQGVVAVARLRQSGITEFRSDDRPVGLRDADLIDVGDWCRPVLRGGRPTLLIEEARDGSALWRGISRERLRAL